MYKYLTLLIILLVGIQCKEPKTEVDSTLGVLEHEFDISEAALPDFEKGLLLIHSFEYDDALTAFQDAKAKDDKEVMAYWGEAMSHYKALWGLQDKRAGYKVLEQLGETKEERLNAIDDELKRDFWEGVEILYGDGSLKERNAEFNSHMEKLSKKYPGNQEASAFYALSMMWDNEKDEDRIDMGKRSASIAQSILKENPLHPGALHYTIHAYDNPLLASDAMEAAEKYSKVAPDAAHALHMPSHIFLALGMWPEVVSSNEASYAASVKRMEKLGLDDEARGYHSYAWLHYAYLQQGRVKDAEKLLTTMSDFYENTQSKSIRSYIAAMQAAQLFETGKWPDGLQVIEITKSDLGLGTHMREALFDAKMAYMTSDVKKIVDVHDELLSEIKKGELYISEDKGAMCSAGPSRYAPNEDAVLKAKVVQKQVEAFMNLANNDEEAAEKAMREAAKLESESEYSFGPTDISLPSFEMLGYFLLDKGIAEEAVNFFTESLERAPGRRNALLGLVKAYEILGNQSAKEEIRQQLAGMDSEETLSSL